MPEWAFFTYKNVVSRENNYKEIKKEVHYEYQASENSGKG